VGPQRVDSIDTLQGKFGRRVNWIPEESKARENRVLSLVQDEAVDTLYVYMAWLVDLRSSLSIGAVYACLSRDILYLINENHYHSS
jgi:hypothetical protein